MCVSFQIFVYLMFDFYSSLHKDASCCLSIRRQSAVPTNLGLTNSVLFKKSNTIKRQDNYQYKMCVDILEFRIQLSLTAAYKNFIGDCLMTSKQRAWSVFRRTFFRGAFASGYSRLCHQEEDKEPYGQHGVLYVCLFFSRKARFSHLSRSSNYFSVRPSRGRVRSRPVESFQPFRLLLAPNFRRSGVRALQVGKAPGSARPSAAYFVIRMGRASSKAG